MSWFQSRALLHSDHGTRLPSEDTPKGRVWAHDATNGYRIAQVMFLTADDRTCRGIPSVSHDLRQMVREHLAENGYTQTVITNADGGKECRWLRGGGDTMRLSLG